MKKYLHMLSAAVLAALVSSCEIPFALDDVSEPAIYLQYLPSTVEGAPLLAAYADPSFKKASGGWYPFVQEDVEIRVNGTLLPYTGGAPEVDGNSFLLYPGCRFAPGDEVELKVKGHGVKDVSARTVVPDKPEIKAVGMEPVTTETGSAVRVTLELGADVAQGDYYGLKTALRTTVVQAVYKLDPSIIFTSPGGLPAVPERTDTSVIISYTTAGQIATTSDINHLDLDGFANVSYKGGLIGGGMFSGEPMMLLGARQFEGGRYSFYVNSYDSFSIWYNTGFGGLDDTGEQAEGGSYDDLPPDIGDILPEEGEEDQYFSLILSQSTELRLEVFRLSPKLYNWCKAQYLADFNMLSNFGVTPPNFTYTNVVNGLGIVGAISGTVTDWMELPEAEEE